MNVTDYRPRLICLPYAGGNRHAFAAWQAALQGRIELIAPELPGRGHRIMDVAFSRLDDSVEWLLRELDSQLVGDYSLWGHSMGALLAYEMARAIERRAGPRPRHVFVTGALPPRLPRRAHAHHLLGDAALTAQLALMNGTPAEVLADTELMAIVLPCIRADFAVCETYEWDPKGGVLHVPLTVIGGDRDPDVAVDKLQGWRSCTTGTTRVLSMAGDHFFLRDQVDALTDLFIQTLVPSRPMSVSA